MPMLIEPSLDELLEKVDNKFKLVTLAMKRARELNDGFPRMIESETSKPVSLALREIASGKVAVTEPVPVDESEAETETDAFEAALEAAEAPEPEVVAAEAEAGAEA